MSRVAAPVRAVLFDYGMTLVGFERPVAALEAAQADVSAAIADAGHAAPSPDTLRTAVYDHIERAARAHEDSGVLEEMDVGALERSAFARLGLELDEPLLDTCSRLIQEAWFQGVRPYPEVPGILRELRDAGLRIGICSNAPYRPASMHEQLRHTGLAGLVDSAVFSGEIGWRKPSPRLFAAALTAVGCDADETVFVGDRLREDVAGAHAMGMRAVLVARDGSGYRADPGAVARPDAVVTTLRELPAVLRDLGSGTADVRQEI